MGSNMPASSLWQFRPRRLKSWLLLRLLNQYRKTLNAEGKEAAADAVLDVMESVSGWCSSNWRLS